MKKGEGMTRHPETRTGGGHPMNQVPPGEWTTGKKNTSQMLGPMTSYATQRWERLGCMICQGMFGDLDLIHQNFRMPEINIKNEFVHSSMVDKTYQLIGSHIDLNTQEKIVRGKYVDFSRLIPKDNVQTVDDNRYEMVIRDGKTYWIPA